MRNGGGGWGLGKGKRPTCRATIPGNFLGMLMSVAILAKIEARQISFVASGLMSAAESSSMKVMLAIHSRVGVDNELLGFCLTESPQMITCAMVNDKGRWSTRHGSLTWSPDPNYIYRAHFHCLGPVSLEDYKSYLDFSPNGTPECQGRDHKWRKVSLKVHSWWTVKNDVELWALMMRKWNESRSNKRKLSELL